MLRLTLKPGEYITIGEDIKVIFTGGNENNMYVGVEAPREYKVLRNKLYESEKLEKDEDYVAKKYYVDEELSQEAKDRIKRVIQIDRAKRKKKKMY